MPQAQGTVIAARFLPAATAPYPRAASRRRAPSGGFGLSERSQLFGHQAGERVGSSAGLGPGFLPLAAFLRDLIAGADLLQDDLVGGRLQLERTHLVDVVVETVTDRDRAVGAKLNLQRALLVDRGLGRQ